MKLAWESRLVLVILTSALIATLDINAQSAMWDHEWNLLRVFSITFFTLAGALWLLIVAESRKTLFPVWALLASVPSMGLLCKYLLAPVYWPLENYLMSWVLMPSEILANFIPIIPLGRIGTSHVSADLFFNSWIQLVLLNGILLFALMIVLHRGLYWVARLKRSRS